MVRPFSYHFLLLMHVNCILAEIVNKQRSIIFSNTCKTKPVILSEKVKPQSTIFSESVQKRSITFSDVDVIDKQ